MYRYGVFVLVVWMGALPARAEIYKFIDDNGMVTYTNMPRPGVKPQIVIADPVKSGASTGAKPASQRSNQRSNASRASPSPQYFPKVDASTQRKRDDMRRQLLEEELASEQRSLSAARTALNTLSRRSGADYDKQLEGVRLHEKNIEMLKKKRGQTRFYAHTRGGHTAASGSKSTLSHSQSDVPRQRGWVGRRKENNRV